MKEEIVKRFLYGLNVAYGLFGLGVAIVGLWFYVLLTEFLALRNVDHYLLDFRVYWVQIVPWVFVILGLTALILGFCGLIGANIRSKILLKVYCAFLILLIIGQVVTAVLVFLYIDNEETDKFVKDTIYDGFNDAVSEPRILAAFNIVEREYDCCGANSARDYRSFRNALPSSCCEDIYGVPCTFSNTVANEKFGCAEVVSFYTKIVCSVVAGVSLVICIVEIIDLYFAFKLLKLIRKRG